MFDIWAFLLQTLTVSGVALLILVVKRLFRDKLPPKWQFSIWLVVAAAMVMPAGLGGRYVLVNWPMVVDLLKTQAGDYSFTRVLFPFPALTAAPKSVWDWLFVVYMLGVGYHLLKYLTAYIRLRSALSRGREIGDDRAAALLRLASPLKVPLCKCVEVDGLPSAFVCGLFSPILAIPMDKEVDEKVLLHELLHLKHRDTVWSILICLFKSIHWCNPFLIHCGDQAQNDLEARCDQMVLEMLDGEDRRDYGRILLSMANDRYANTPGATCINNGGKAIRQRIEAIARFRLYPAGMRLVSVCAIVILLLPVVFGVQASSLYETGSVTPLDLSSARTAVCTTPAGAFDCYAKAVLTGKDTLRVMCAPESMQAELAAQFGDWEPELPIDPVISSGYYIYNLTETGEGYEGLLVLELSSPETAEKRPLGTQLLRAQQEQGRWVVTPLGDFTVVETNRIEAINWGCPELSGILYSATYEEFLVELREQTVYEVDNWLRGSGFFGGYSSFDLTPKPNAEFSKVSVSHYEKLIHLGTQEQRDEITYLGVGFAPAMPGEEPPDRAHVGSQNGSGSSSDGSSWVNHPLEPGWGPVVDLLGGGSGYSADDYPQERPLYYLAELYLNGRYTAALELLPQEGGFQ